ncbi:Protein kinase-like domain-containing protein [Strongyloides ratti]|uniref:Protein kinase-like domain-containing protein n=1 Tax=Strongyloides ratti TaxID=34506 RepID=A0A090KY54_STRRB|nr:Protein kinase-like domain-containing protein [Strongyloides ratti]CEF60143.1 Protein kinase-like domain-containing protein [Strongyloides ratti]
MGKNITGETLRNALLSGNNETECNKLSREFKIQCMKLAKYYLSGVWQHLTEDNFLVTKVTGGLSNLIFKIELPSHIKPTGKEPSCALIRIHGSSSSLTLIIDTIIFTILSERSMGPKLFGIFSEGRLEEYIPSRCLSKIDLHQECVQKNVAFLLSQIHTLCCPIKKESVLVDQIKQWLKNIELKLGKNAKWEIKTTQIDSKYSKNAPKYVTLESLKNELEYVEECLNKSNSPIVFCHNDLQEGNILLSNEYELTKEGKLKKIDNDIDESLIQPFFVIDYEYANYNYRGFDFGNHFCEWGISYDTEDSCGYTINTDHFPTSQKMKVFLKEYLNSFYSNQNTDSNFSLTYDFKKDMKTLIDEGERFMAVSHYFWSIWSFEMETHKEIEFGYVPYGIDRLCLYFEGKKELSKYLK